MLIQNGRLIEKSKSDKLFETEDVKICLAGFLYLPNESSLDNTLQIIASHILSSNYNVLNNLRGQYFICISLKKLNKSVCFVDNSGMFKVYRYDNMISTSLLGLIKFADVKFSDLDYDKTVEFIQFGFTYGKRSLFKGIETIDKNEILIIENNELRTNDKPKIREGINSPFSLEKFFSELINSVKNYHISIDLTGGNDSRLLLALLYSLGLKFELALSGVPGIRDIKIAKKIAQSLHLDFHVMHHTIDDITENKIQHLFNLCDLKYDLITFHRINQLTEDRLHRGIDLQLSGVAAEFARDTWWLHEFPFYNRSTISIEKFYHIRFQPKIFPHYILGEALLDHSFKISSRIIHELGKYKLESNTKTIDNIYYSYKLPSNIGNQISISNQTMASYAPFLEQDYVYFGMNLPKIQRFYNNFHRQKISELCPTISKIKTTEGVTCSNHNLDKFFDVFFYTKDKSARLLRKMLEKMVGKTYLQENPTNQLIYEKIKKMEIFNESINILKKEKFLNNNISINQLRKEDIGRFLTLGLLFQELK